jgi:hypothetical protein
MMEELLERIIGRLTALEREAVRSRGLDYVPAGLVRLESQVLGAPAASVSFTSIPGAYETLVLILSGRTNHTDLVNLLLRCNSDTGANYDQQIHLAAGDVHTVANAQAQTSAQCGYLPGAAQPAGAAGAVRVEIPGYARTIFNKVFYAHCSAQMHTGATASWDSTHTGTWRSTSAITALTLSPSAGNLIAGTVATLYAVRGG